MWEDNSSVNTPLPSLIDMSGDTRYGTSSGADTYVPPKGFWETLGGLFTGSSGLFDSKLANQLAQLAAFGGLGGLLNKLGSSTPQGPVGYQGGIPTLMATRMQTPMAQQRPAGYRPGQGGITYFTPVRYTTPGAAVTLAPESVSPSAPVSPETLVTEDTMSRRPTPVTESMTGMAGGGYMPGGITMLAGGRFLRGPGDGVSDSIKARFERSGQPARLADGEFVIDARTVSELGNGSSEAGARKLYAMMDRVHKARKSAQRGKPSGADKFLPK